MATVWTEEMDIELRRRYTAGDSFRQCADGINKLFDMALTRNACIGRASRIKLTGRVPRPMNPHASKTAPIKRERVQYSPQVRRAVVVIDHEIIKPLPRPELDAMSLKLDIDGLRRNSCRWPSGGDNGDPITFCGCPKAPKLSYCEPHARIASPALAIPAAERELQRLRGRRLARENRMVAA